MRLPRSIFAALALILMGANTVASDWPMAAQPQFSLYSIEDGLAQKTVSGITQDQDGFLWVATFGGLSRFDGSAFKNYTTSQGLRQKLIQAVMADSQNRVWAGDAAGGLTLLKDSRVVRTFEPDKAVRGISRAMITVGDNLYHGIQPGGLLRLDLNNMDAGQMRVEESPSEVLFLASRGTETVYLVTLDGLYRYRPGHTPTFELIVEGASAIQSDGKGQIAVGHRDGRIGMLADNDQVIWDDLNYGAEVSGVVFKDGQLHWVFLDGKRLVPYGQPNAPPMLPTIGAAAGVSPAGTLYDQEGVLWVPLRSGLARYLGPRFEHFPLETDGQRPEVLSISPDAEGGYWFGTSEGLVHVDRLGTQTNVSDKLGIARREVRALALSRDKRTLWIAQILGPAYGIDVESRRIKWTLGDDSQVTVSAVIDDQDRLWLGHYAGVLSVFDPKTGDEEEFTFGKGAAIYGLDIADDGVLWVSANYQGVYRLDIRNPAATPELNVPVAELGQEFFSHLVTRGTDDDTEIWLAGIEGEVIRVSNGRPTRIIDQNRLDGKTIYAVQPLDDGTVIIASSRGVYRYDIQRDRLDYYSALDGYVAIESRAHAIHYDAGDHILLGTTSGVTAMDVSQPMDPVATPKPLIVESTLDEQITESPLLDVRGYTARVRYAAVSTRRPDGLEYSYQLIGNETDWSAPTTTRSHNYSNLDHGSYTFAVRARLPEGEWSDPAQWSFTIPTPVWQTLWFKVLAVLLVSFVAWLGLQMRLQAIARANLRLREQVEERTRSIEDGRRELVRANLKLSNEIQERLKADERREEVEARFQQAYHNSPVGMALVDTEGLVYDANAKMKSLFWPVSDTQVKKPLLSIVEQEDRELLQEFLASCATEHRTPLNMEVNCRAHDGQIRRIDFHPSAIRSTDGQLKYLVLLANDVTESRAMTEKLAYQARYDELTGLINRWEFARLLEQANVEAGDGSLAYLMFLDLDQFKVVNDTCGHAAGDELLRTIAELITSCVRKNDTVARLGGDEFGVIVRDCTEETALERAESIRERIKNLVFHRDNEVFRVGASIGVVSITSGDIDLNELQQIADAACYAAKEAGRNRVHLVSGDKDPAHEHRGDIRWVQRLNHAIENDNFVLYGQRIASLGNKSSPVERVEVLLRMLDSAGGRTIVPGAFLPAAERYGLQDRLDHWVVSKLIEMLRTQGQGELADKQFWVNLSGASIGDATMANTLIDLVSNANLPRGCLNFEITETAVVRKITDATRLISSLRAMGCRFALDDFGSGLSSFGYLKQFSVDLLKIDGQFVKDIDQDPTDRIFVKSLIDIAHTLKLETVAEFVENDDVLSVVEAMGSDYAQGFGLHRPEPLENLVGPPMLKQMLGGN